MAIVSKGDFDDEDEETKELKYPRISYRQLIEATGGFSASSRIGSGRFGQVYKGILRDNTRIAVKVLDTTTVGEFSYFGIARLVKSDDSMPTSDSSCNSTHGLLCGSLGHIALGVYQILFCYKDLQINTY